MSDTQTAPKPKRSTWEAIAVFFDRRALVMLALGFAAGLPNLLLFDTLSVWLRQAKIPLDVIGLFSLVTITYAVKFLWAPIVDRRCLRDAHCSVRRDAGHRDRCMEN